MHRVFAGCIILLLFFCSLSHAQWRQVTDHAPWTASPTFAVMNNQLYATDGTKLFASSDGASWTTVSDVPDGPRTGFSFVAFASKQWIFAGSPSGSMWSSSDGVTWSALENGTEGVDLNRTNQIATVLPGGIWMGLTTPGAVGNQSSWIYTESDGWQRYIFVGMYDVGVPLVLGNDLIVLTKDGPVPRPSWLHAGSGGWFEFNGGSVVVTNKLAWLFGGYIKENQADANDQVWVAGVNEDGASWDPYYYAMPGEGRLNPATALVGNSIMMGGGISKSTANLLNDVWTLDVAPVEVHIEQEADQPDPTNVLPARFHVSFSKPLIFSVKATDFVQSGTANGVIFTLSGGGMDYTLSATATSDGTIIPVLPPNTHIDINYNNNLLSTGVDNSVTIDAPPQVNISPPSSHFANMGPVGFLVQYSGAQSVDLNTSKISVISTGDAAASVRVTGDGTEVRYVELTDFTGVGTVAIQLGAGTATDGTGNLDRGSAVSQAIKVFSAASITPCTLPDDQRSVMMDLYWFLYDTDGVGGLTIEQAINIYATPAEWLNLQQTDPSFAQAVLHLFENIDVNSDGLITRSEFADADDGGLSVAIGSYGAPVTFDLNKDGLMQFNEVSERTTQSLFDRADVNRNGVIDGRHLNACGSGSVAVADENGDFHIGLDELLRVIQFYNAGGYHCDPTGEDGYAPYAGDQGCFPHSSDYAPVDWKINLSELLRLVQLYNSGTYHICNDATTEDGFCLG